MGFFSINATDFEWIDGSENNSEETNKLTVCRA